MRPKCEVNYHVSGGWCMRDGDCATCEAKHNGVCKRGLFVFTNEEKIASLVDALKELWVDVPQWMPIETAPKDITILVSRMGYIEIARYDSRLEEWQRDVTSVAIQTPTHWMPLPTKPTE